MEKVNNVSWYVTHYGVDEDSMVGDTPFLTKIIQQNFLKMTSNKKLTSYYMCSKDYNKWEYSTTMYWATHIEENNPFMAGNTLFCEWKCELVNVSLCYAL